MEKMEREAEYEENTLNGEIYDLKDMLEVKESSATPIYNRKWRLPDITKRSKNGHFTIYTHLFDYIFFWTSFAFPAHENQS